MPVSYDKAYLGQIHLAGESLDGVHCPNEKSLRSMHDRIIPEPLLSLALSDTLQHNFNVMCAWADIAV